MREENEGASGASEASAGVMIAGAGIVGRIAATLAQNARLETVTVTIEALGTTARVSVMRVTGDPMTEIAGETAIETAVAGVNVTMTVDDETTETPTRRRVVRRVVTMTPEEIETAIATAEKRGIMVATDGRRTMIAGESAVVRMIAAQNEAAMNAIAGEIATTTGAHVSVIGAVGTSDETRPPTETTETRPVSEAEPARLSEDACICPACGRTLPRNTYCRRCVDMDE